MSEDKHICGFCENKDCPEAGNEKYDGMLGPTIGCTRYDSGPTIWTIIFAPLIWICSWISRR